MSLMRRFLAVALLGLSVSLTPALAQSDAKPGSPRLAEPTPPGASLGQLAEDDADLQTVLNTLRAEAAAKGSVKVAVRTAVPYAPEARLGDQERLQQRQEIAAAAKALRLALPATRSFEASEDKPHVIIDLNGAGLARLVAFPGLVRIFPEEQFNWQRDLVQMRVNAVTARNRNAQRLTSPAEKRAVTPKIVGGVVAAPSTHPFQIGIVAKRIRNNFQAQFCGGTLVAERYVVTAAHCIEDVTDAYGQIQVLVGTQRLNRGGRRIGVAEVLMHPLYDGWTLDYDVAVLRLTTPVTGIPFASLAASEPTVAGTILRSSGWGRLVYRGTKPSSLMEVDLPFVPTVDGSCINEADITIKTINENALSAPPPAFNFAAATQTVSEGARRVTLTVTRESPVEAASVRFATADGTALNRSDFRSRSGIVRFRHGQSAATITITLVNDRVKEGDEAFTVTLSQPSSGWTIGANGTTTVTITDND